MGLSSRLLRAAAARPHVLVVATPGATAARLAAERELLLRDWPAALTPAQADLLVVLGPHCPGLNPALERLWQDTPRPRALVRAHHAEQVALALDAGRAVLESPAEHGSGRQGTSSLAAAHTHGRVVEQETGREHDGAAHHPKRGR